MATPGAKVEARGCLGPPALRIERFGSSRPSQGDLPVEPLTWGNPAFRSSDLELPGGLQGKRLASSTLTKTRPVKQPPGSRQRLPPGRHLYWLCAFPLKLCPAEAPVQKLSGSASSLPCWMVDKFAEAEECTPCFNFQAKVTPNVVPQVCGENHLQLI